MTLHLGVVDVPYGDEGVKSSKTPNQTTGDVALILERRYGVMAGYYDLHGQDVADACAEAMAGALEDLLLGAPVTDPLAGADEAIGEGFREFIDREELVAEGVPTAAALRGVSHRFKRPYAQGHPRRPSFVDTGMYRESFRAWFTGFSVR